MRLQVALEREDLDVAGQRVDDVQQAVAAHDQIKVAAGDEEPADLAGRVGIADAALQLARGVVVPHDSVAEVGDEDVLVGRGDRRERRLLAERLPRGRATALRAVDLDVLLHADVDLPRHGVIGPTHGQAVGLAVQGNIGQFLAGAVEGADQLVAGYVEAIVRADGQGVRPRAAP